MSFTRTQWANDLLAALGNSNPNPVITQFVVGWTAFETGANSGATYNLLNTTQRTSDSVSDFNSVGVQNYASYSGGINATVQTLQNGLYPQLLAALQTNNTSALTTSPVLENLSTWCGGCGYGNSFLSAGASHANDSFDYGSQSPVTGTPLSFNSSSGSTTAATPNTTSAESGCSWYDIGCGIVWAFTTLESNVLNGLIQGGIVVAGFILILVGIIILFFAHGAPHPDAQPQVGSQGGETVETEEVAAVA